MTVMKLTPSNASSASSNRINQTCKICGEGRAYERPFLFLNDRTGKWVKYWMLICDTCRCEYAGSVQITKSEEVRGV